MRIFKTLNLIPDGIKLLCTILTHIFKRRSFIHLHALIKQFHKQFSCRKIRYCFLLPCVNRVKDNVRLCIINFFMMKRKSFVPSAMSIAVGIITIKAFLTNRVLVLDPAYANRVVHNPTIATVNIVLGIVLVCVGVFSLFGGLVLNPIAKKKAAKAAVEA